MINDSLLKNLCILAFILVFAGCTTTRIISIKSEPSEAKLEITADPKWPSYSSVWETPMVKHKFKFGNTPQHGPSRYNVKISKDGYESETLTMTKDNYRSNVNVTLNHEVVREITRLEEVISEKGYTLELRTVRAWVEDIERDVAAASSIVRLGENLSILGMDISRDGTTLVFSLAENVKDERGQEKQIATLRSVSVHGGGITQITNGQFRDINPAFDSTGDAILFNSNRMRRHFADIFSIPAKREGGIGVIRQTSEGMNYQASAEKGMIVFTYKPIYKQRIFGTEQVWSIGGENGYPTQLREGSMPELSPDGTTIVFIGKDKQLWKISVTGQNPVQLTNTPINKEGKKHPVWSPDGKYIVYASDDGKDSRNVANYDIWIINEDGTTSRQLTTNGSMDDYPLVTPDQKYLYFVSNRGFKDGIWRIPFPCQSK